SSDGIVALNPDIPQDKQWDAYIEKQRWLLLQRTKGMEDRFYQTAGCTPSSLDNKLVILVDDGVATGMTAIAAIETAKQRGAKRTILAAPVMSKESYKELSAYADQIVSLVVPDNFMCVGQYYLDFTQVSDDDVIMNLREAMNIMHPNRAMS
ncbi:MAG: hypothetical protein K8F91_05765, partial [Candidatus Obscuribacterales bacterium]|nr:hypothetical protein [Candidatus Obscuribacterales bacterium]